MGALNILAIALLLYAALHDLAARTVPNWLPLAVAVIGCLIRITGGSLLPALVIAGGTFAVLFGIWLAGAIGGGDVKLWAATALLIPPEWQPEMTFVLRVVLTGGALALVYLVLSFCIPRPEAVRPTLRVSRALPPRGLLGRVLRAETWRIGHRAPLPYAFAIAAGAITVLAMPSFPVLG